MKEKTFFCESSASAIRTDLEKSPETRYCKFRKRSHPDRKPFHGKSDELMSRTEQESEDIETIQIGENAFVPVRYVDEDGDVLEYDGTGQWTARDENGEIRKIVSF